MIAASAKVFHRSPAFAQDNSSSISAVQEFLQAHPETNHVALLQCTSPFIKPEYLIKMAHVYQNAECVFSVSRSYKLRWSQDENLLKPINFNVTHRPRRQDWTGELIENGMFYLAPKTLLLTGQFQTENCGIVEIDAADSLEIDSPIDLLVAEILEQHKVANKTADNATKLTISK